MSLWTQAEARALHADVALARALGEMAWTYYGEQRLELAESYDEESLAVAHAAGNDDAVARAMFSLGIVYRAGGQGELAVHEYNDALTYSLKAPDRESTALIYNALGSIERERGNYDDALRHHRAALAIFEKLGDRASMAGTKNNIGNTLERIGDQVAATKIYEEALALAEETKSERITAYALNNLGNLYARRGDYKLATRAYERSVALKQRLADRRTLANAYLNLGELERDQNHGRAAFAWYLKTLTLANELEQIDPYIRAEIDLALLMQHDGNPHVALYFADHAVLLARQYAKPLLVMAGSARAAALADLGRRKEARAGYQEAIDAAEIERLQTASRPPQQRALFLESRMMPYIGMVDLLASRSPADALRYAESAKARVLIELLHAELHDSRRLAKMPAGSAALEFVVDETRTCILVLDASGRVRSRISDIGGEELSRSVKRLREQLAQRDHGFDAASTKLFHRLLGKVWPLVRDKQKLVIVPDGNLWELPFQALRAPDGRYLIEHAAISYAPSLTALAEMEQIRTKHSPARVPLIAFGDVPATAALPSLPETARQLRALAKMYGPSSRFFTESHATEQELRANAPAARVLQIATHGILDDRNPMDSQLVFAPGHGEDGRLDGREIARLPLRSDLVVLSACDTARGSVHQGEGIIGMAWALFLAGSPSTVVSQWSVEDASTTALMIHFHEGLRAGATKSAALRDAELAISRNGTTRHPFYWAAFVVIGDDAPIR